MKTCSAKNMDLKLYGKTEKGRKARINVVVSRDLLEAS